MQTVSNVTTECNAVASSNFTAALLWRSRGFTVLPILPDGKKPALRWGDFTENQTDERVRDHWIKHPDHLVAVRADGLFIIDCDDEQAEASYRSMVAPFGPAPFCTMRTARGHHYYYALPSDAPRVASRGDSAPGYIDIKTGKSYVVVTGPGREELSYTPERSAISAEQIALAYACNNESWPFPMAAPRQRVAWEGEPSKLLELQLMLQHIDAAELGYMDYLSVVAGVHQEFGGADEALDMLLDWSADPDETAYKWDTFTVGRPAGTVTLATVAKLAQARGADLSEIAHKAQFSRVFGAPPSDAPVVAVAPAPASAQDNYTPLAQLKSWNMPALTGDQKLDAIEIVNHVFGGRIINAGGDVLHWWNGRFWEKAEDRILRNHISTAQAGGGGKSTAGRTTGTLQMMRDHAPYVKLDPPSRRVFFRDGVLDLATGELLPHSPEHGNSFALNVPHAPGTLAPRWQAWLADIFETEPERIELLQEMMGWCLISDTLGIEKAMAMTGPARAGKGIIIRIIRDLLGDGSGAGSFRFKTLAGDKQIESLARCQVAIDPDAVAPKAADATVVSGLIKTITANEPVARELLYTQVVAQGELNCKLLIGANGIPHLFDDSAALANRWVPLAFNKSFLGHEDPELLNKLRPELTGIAQWALEGLQRLMATRRFTLPESSLNALALLQQGGSPLQSFVEETCTVHGNTRGAPGTPDQAVYNAYTLWCAANGEGSPMTKSTFIGAMNRTGLHMGFGWSKSFRIGGKDHRAFRGLTLKGAAAVVPISA